MLKGFDSFRLENEEGKTRFGSWLCDFAGSRRNHRPLACDSPQSVPRRVEGLVFRLQRRQPIHKLRLLRAF